MSILATLRASSAKASKPAPEPSRPGSGFGPAVLDGRIRYVSVSQIEKFDAESYGGCERRWWFRYVAGRAEPSIRAQRLGTQVHSQIEHYLRTGQDVLGDLVRVGFHFLPAPQTVAPGLEVETSVGGLREHLPGGVLGPVDSELDVAGVPVVGYVDALNSRGQCKNEAAENVIEPGVVEVVDWKTTKRIDDEVDPDTGIVVAKGLAKTAEELSRTHQMVNYGELALRRYPSATAVRLSHVVFQTTGERKAVKRTSIITVDELRTRRLRSQTVVERMMGVAATAEVESVPANLKACGAYGGCPHRSVCPRDPKQVLAQLFGGKTMSLLDKIRQKPSAAIAATVPPVATPSAPAPTVATTPDPTAVAAAAQQIAAEEAAMRSASVTPPDVPASSVTTTPVVEAEAPKKRKTKTETVAPSNTTGLVLYLNCAEDGVPVKRLETYAHELAEVLARAAGAADVRCAPEKSELAFGKWKGALAACAKDQPPPDGAYVVSTSDEVAAVVAEALAPRATRVVRGRP